MRDGILLWMKGCVGPCQVLQQLPKDPACLSEVLEKLLVAREKGHTDVGVANSLMSVFEAPKVLADV